MQLRELRLGRGWSQEHLAEISGLSVRTVQRIENGHTPGLASVSALAAAFGIDVEQLAGTDEPKATGVSFADSTRACLTKYAEFGGRTSCAEYWWFMSFVILAGSLATLLSEVVGAVVLLLLLLPLLAAGTRRLRDAGKSGWWQLLSLVPFGGVVPLALLALPSVETTATVDLARR